MKRTLEKSVVRDDDECEFIPLCEDKTSWIRRFAYTGTKMNSTLFEKLWNMHPEERALVNTPRGPTEIPRLQMTYGDKPYSFSGFVHEVRPITPFLQEFIDYANRVCEAYLKPHEKQFNMVFINWYKDGSEYIGKHSDDEKQLATTSNGETLVFSISFGATRTFRIHPKEKGKANMDFELRNGDALLMGGLCQKHFKHSVPKISGKKGQKVGRRINLTFRIFI